MKPCIQGVVYSRVGDERLAEAESSNSGVNELARGLMVLTCNSENP